MSQSLAQALVAEARKVVLSGNQTAEMDFHAEDIATIAKSWALQEELRLLLARENTTDIADCIKHYVETLADQLSEDADNLDAEASSLVEALKFLGLASIGAGLSAIIAKAVAGVVAPWLALGAGFVMLTAWGFARTKLKREANRKRGLVKSMQGLLSRLYSKGDDDADR